MNMPDLSKVEIPKRGIIFLVYLACVRDIADLKLAVIISVVFIIYLITQTYTDLKGKAQPIEP